MAKEQPKEQRQIDREAEEAYQRRIVEAVAKRNKELAKGANPDRSAEPYVLRIVSTTGATPTVKLVMSANPNVTLTTDLF